MSQPSLQESAILERTFSRFTELAACSESTGNLCRTFGTPAHGRAAVLLSQWMEEAGLTVSTDGWGNVFGRTRVDCERAVVLGSHYDTVKNAGMFDGALGILAGLAALEILGPEFPEKIPFAVEVAAFAEEEGVRFPATYLGSRAAWGLILPEDLGLVDSDGVSLGVLIEPPWHQPAPRYTTENTLAYIEAHIEQGPVLENGGRAIGVVSAIAGQKRFLLSFTGKSGHAGTCPMTLRRDALAGAAAWITVLEALAREIPDLVATVGCLEIPQSATNVIPGLVKLSLDLRHPDAAILGAAEREIMEQASAIAAARGLVFGVEITTDQPPVPLDARLRQKLASVIPGGTVPELVSGAGHDAVIFAPRVPTALLFCRCREGLSHHPDEFVSFEDFSILVETLRRLLWEEQNL